MNLVSDIREKIRAGKFEFSKQAVDQSIKRNIRVEEMEEALLNGEVIEDTPMINMGPVALFSDKLQMSVRFTFNAAIRVGI